MNVLEYHYLIMAFPGHEMQGYAVCITAVVLSDDTRYGKRLYVYL